MSILSPNEKNSPQKTNSAQLENSNSMWGGRFSTAPAAIMQHINASLPVDKRLAKQDLANSQAHATMLAAQKIISAEDAAAIAKGLATIEQEIEAGTFPFDIGLEDIHMNIEARLANLIGAAAGRLHTARSRNDQVATSFRLWVREALDGLDQLLQQLQQSLINKAEAEADTIMPGFTHLQIAQPVTMGHHLLAYVEMLGRDRHRLTSARQRVNECPLGAAALAGSPFPLDRGLTAQLLGFERPMRNSMDAVADRDFAVDFLYVASMVGVHLSRLAEEIILWSCPLFGFVQLSDAFTTGSSIMPQKRNPDAAELVRGKSGALMGGLSNLLMMLKALPLTYAKDMQEDKATVFAAFDTLELCLYAMKGMVEDLTVKREHCLAATQLGHITATDLADWLVMNCQMPFRQAHHITGRLVSLAESRGVSLAELPLADMQALEAGINENIFSCLTVAHSIHTRQSQGGTAPVRVKEACMEARRIYL
ncbi:MAG: argininosuccinate lyase [Alphaproteobacteria bacterium]